MIKEIKNVLDLSFHLDALSSFLEKARVGCIGRARYLYQEEEKKHIYDAFLAISGFENLVKFLRDNSVLVNSLVSSGVTPDYKLKVFCRRCGYTNNFDSSGFTEICNIDEESYYLCGVCRNLRNMTFKGSIHHVDTTVKTK